MDIQNLLNLISQKQVKLNTLESDIKEVLDVNTKIQINQEIESLKKEIEVYLKNLSSFALEQNTPSIGKSETKDLAGKSYIKKSISEEEFIETLNLKNANDSKKLIIYMFEKRLKKNVGTINCSFMRNCLEMNLNRRLTTYQPDSEKNVIQILLAVSGAGKTRTLLELLYSSFGYYFTFNLSGSLGSNDLTSCMIDCGYNPNSTEYLIELLYFIRVTICNHLISKRQEEKNEKIEAWEILLAQLHPREYFGLDIFDDLFKFFTNNKIILSFEFINPFPFAAVDEIQLCVEAVSSHQLPGSLNMRPFFSPFVFYSRQLNLFSLFIISGTGINFELVNEMMNSTTMKSNQNTAFEIVSPFTSMSKKEVENYASFILNEHGIADVEEIVQKISGFDLCHGRSRFVAFILDIYLETRDIDYAFSQFIHGIYDVQSSIFPLKFFKRDLEKQKISFNRIISNDTLSTIIRKGFLSLLKNGNLIINVTEDIGASAIRYGLGFGGVESGILQSIEIKEKAIIECLRHFLPFTHVILELLQEMASCFKPAMIGYLLEYLIAYTLVSNVTSVQNVQQIKPSVAPLSFYLLGNDDSEICFPDHMCGPDIMYKCNNNKTIYIVQIKFSEKISKQKITAAYATTDPNLFYCNRTTGNILRGFEEKRRNTLKHLQSLENNNDFKLKRILFIHSDIILSSFPKEKNVEIITKETYPNFFDNVDSRIWFFLDSLREKTRNQNL